MQRMCLASVAVAAITKAGRSRAQALRVHTQRVLQRDAARDRLANQAERRSAGVRAASKLQSLCMAVWPGVVVVEGVVRSSMYTKKLAVLDIKLGIWDVRYVCVYRTLSKMQ